MAEAKAQLLPVYFVPDQSNSMKDLLGELNAGLSALLDTMNSKDVDAAAIVRFSVVGFSEEVMEHLRLTDLRTLPRMPELHAYRGTYYYYIFSDLRQRIEVDVKQLQDDGYAVYRPMVFFLTDGEPNGPAWKGSLDALKSEEFLFRPHILAFGLGEADESVVREIATKTDLAFIEARGADTGNAMSTCMKALVKTIVQTARTSVQGGTSVVANEPPGFVRLDVLSKY